MLRSMMKPSNNNLSNHILPASANLLGICFLIFAMTKALGKADATLIDELAGTDVVIFLLASICSYVSMRKDRENYFERAADIFFMLGLVLLAVSASLISFNIIV